MVPRGRSTHQGRWPVSIDEGTLRSLIEESDDLHCDAMRTTKAGLADVVDQGLERRAAGTFDPEETRAYQMERRHLLAKGLTGVGAFSGTAFGVGLYQLLTQPAFADSSQDIQAGQTAASIENLAIQVYTTAAGLPFMKIIPDPAGATVVAFVTKTVAQHTEHAKAFNAAVVALGGKPQNNPDDAAYKKLVVPTLPTLKAPLDVVNFAAKLEQLAAETYVKETAAVSDKVLRNTFASIMGVEAQHVSILLAVGALLQGGAPQLISIPPPANLLPAAAGSIGFPDSFLKTDQAIPPTEGVVR